MQDDKDLDKLKDLLSNKNKKDEEDMALAEKELKDMQQTQIKKMTREEIRNAMLKRSIEKNYNALQRLSRT